MLVEIDAMVEDYLMRDEWLDNGALLQHANQHSRLFYQQLQEMVLPDCDRVTIERDGAVPIGDNSVDCLVFTLERNGYAPKAAWFPSDMLQSRHAVSQELLFRGHHFIEGVLIPLAQSPWLEASLS